MRALGELFGPVDGSLGAKMRAQGGQKKKFRKFKEPPRVPKSRKRAPKKPPRAPKTSQRQPQTPPKASLYPEARFFKIRALAKAKSRFLRVAGSAWELNIDTKMGQDENMLFEERAREQNPKRDQSTITKPKQVVREFQDSSTFFEGDVWAR